MNQDDFFQEIESVNPWGGGSTTTTKLRRDLLNQLRGGPAPGVGDLDAAIALTQLVWNDLIAYGTGGGNVLARENEAIRGLANRVIELAHGGKHSTAPTRREAACRAARSTAAPVRVGWIASPAASICRRRPQPRTGTRSRPRPAAPTRRSASAL